MERPKHNATIQERIHLLVKVKMEGSVAEAIVATAALQVIAQLQEQLQTIRDATLAERHIKAGGNSSEFQIHGKTYKRLDFGTLEELEAFFVSSLLGSEYKYTMIGKTLIYWH